MTQTDLERASAQFATTVMASWGLLDTQGAGVQPHGILHKQPASG